MNKRQIVETRARSPPQFKLYGKPTLTKNGKNRDIIDVVDGQFLPISKLDDETQVRKKPKITKKGQSILRSKQEQDYAWLFNILSGGKDTVNYESICLDVLPQEALACFMPILVVMRDKYEAC